MYIPNILLDDPDEKVAIENVFIPQHFFTQLANELVELTADLLLTVFTDKSEYFNKKKDLVFIVDPSENVDENDLSQLRGHLFQVVDFENEVLSTLEEELKVFLISGCFVQRG